MPTIVPPGFVEAAIELRAAGDPDPWYVTFGLESSAVGGDYGLMAVGVMQAWDNVMGLMGSYVSNTGVAFTVGQDGPDNLRVYVASTIARPGGRATGMLPQNSALLVQKNTAIGGRRNRGRMFIPAVLAEGDVNNVGLIEPGSIGVFQDAVNLFFTDLTSYVDVPMEMVILHGSEGISVAGDPTPVVNLTVDPVISTQRRRLR